MGVFADAAPEYLDHGRPCFPVNADKRPLVKGWLKAGRPATEQWARKYPDANVGLCCGPKTGLTVVDVDDEGEAPVADAMSRFGQTPVVIRTATGKHHLWYAHNGEKRSIRVDVNGWNVDLLGTGGYTVAPPSQRPDLFSRYEFVQGSLDDLDRLPTINPDASPAERTEALQRAQQQVQQPSRADGLVPEGQRDDWLFRRLLKEARHVDGEDALRDLAFSYNTDALAEPLPAAQVEKVIASVLRYVREGRNYTTRATVAIPHDVHDALIDAPYAFALLAVLRRNHPRPDETFAIAPKPMAEAGNPPWSDRTIERARDTLHQRGFLELVYRGRGRGNPSRWRLKNT